MGQYQGASQWQDNVYQYDLTDPVIGGPNGTANKPLKDLSDRTAWLKDQIGRFNGDEVITASKTITADEANKLLTVYAYKNDQQGLTGIVDLLLADAATFKHGAMLPFSVFTQPGGMVANVQTGCVVNINTDQNQPIFDTDGAIRSLHVHHKEQVFLVALTDHFKIVTKNGNFDCAGEEFKARKAFGYALPFVGQLVSRAAYPRLLAYVQSLTFGHEVVSEFEWQNGGLEAQGLFSTGDGVTNFRLPDERGLSERMLDLGRGLDVNRTRNYAGGYEADMIGEHTHTLNTTNSDKSNNAGADPVRGSIAGSVNTRGTNGSIGTTGGNETIVKNLAKITQVKF